ncbi:hypothetical protein VNI00_018464 [Paramarasmius palmivorus]|uniref:Uncharacterized protein n=1 Tax=Paramarasmius palmivorus TaxID=297713 RepID=A0AAW0AYW7_9AGAR
MLFDVDTIPAEEAHGEYIDDEELDCAASEILNLHMDPRLCPLRPITCSLGLQQEVADKESSDEEESGEEQMLREDPRLQEGE